MIKLGGLENDERFSLEGHFISNDRNFNWFKNK
jgi:hypothetical protein